MHADRDLNKLNPVFKPMVEKLVSKAKFGKWNLFVTEAFRSDARQDYLYAQGRTRSGKVITNAKAGQSDHNYGRAVDVAFKNIFGKVSWDIELFKKAGIISKDLGISWGGNWTNFKDYPHFFVTKKQIDKKDTLKKYEGKLIYPGNIQNGAKHFLVKNGRLEWIQNEVEFFVSGFSFKDAIAVNPSLLLGVKQYIYTVDDKDPKVKQAKNLLDFAIHNRKLAIKYRKNL